MNLAGRKFFAFQCRLEGIVVAVGAVSLGDRYPLQRRPVVDTVVHATRPRDDEYVTERALELLVLPLAVPRPDAFDQAARVARVDVVDGMRQSLAQRDRDRL